MSTRYYPLYQRGNPQLRVFLPNFWMKLIRPEEPLPPNQVLFQTSIEMTKYDVKNYLEKIYNVPVVEVKVEIKMGEIRRCYGKQNLVKEDDYKEALVTMPRECLFEFPDVTKSTQNKKEMERYKNMKALLSEHQKKMKSRGGVPSWFS